MRLTKPITASIFSISRIKSFNSSPDSGRGFVRDLIHNLLISPMRNEHTNKPLLSGHPRGNGKWPLHFVFTSSMNRWPLNMGENNRETIIGTTGRGRLY